MYKVEMDISDWGDEETLTIETTDFEKVQIIQEFIAFQKEHGWAADYALVTEFDEEDEEEIEEEEDEPVTVSTYVITKIED
jgi:tetrahydromethanopterin S-methyltransferase subunit A